MKAFHVTTKELWEKNISKEGLKVKIGENSESANEPLKAIFLFPEIEDMNTALGSWFGDLFDEETEIAALEITLEGLDIVNMEVGYEIMCLSDIPISAIEFHSYQ